MALNAACGLGVDVSSAQSGVAGLAENAEVVGVVGIFGVGELVDGDDVVDGVCFLSADGAGGVVFEQLLSHVLKVGLVAGCGVALLVVHGVYISFLTPLLRCGCCHERGRVWCGDIPPLF